MCTCNGSSQGPTPPGTPATADTAIVFVYCTCAGGRVRLANSECTVLLVTFARRVLLPCGSVVCLLAHHHAARTAARGPEHPSPPAAWAFKCTICQRVESSQVRAPACCSYGEGAGPTFKSKLSTPPPAAHHQPSHPPDHHPRTCACTRVRTRTRTHARSHTIPIQSTEYRNIITLQCANAPTIRKPAS